MYMYIFIYVLFLTGKVKHHKGITEEEEIQFIRYAFVYLFMYFWDFSDQMSLLF